MGIMGKGFGEHGYYGHPPGYPVVLYEELPLVIYNADIKGKGEKTCIIEIFALNNTGSSKYRFYYF